MKYKIVMLAALSVKLAMSNLEADFVRKEDALPTLGTAVASNLYPCDENNSTPFKTFLCKMVTQSSTSMARGYGHSGVGYHSYGGFEPLTLLAGLAFLAFLLQTLHALLYRAPVSVLSRSNDETLPGLTRSINEAVDKYETLNQQRRMIEDDVPSTWSSSIFDTLGRVFKENWFTYIHTPCFQNVICRIVNTYNQLKAQEESQYP